MVFTCKTFKKNRRPRMTRRLWPKGSKGSKGSNGRRFFTRKLRKQMGGNGMYRELPKHAKGAVDVEPLEWDT